MPIPEWAGRGSSCKASLNRRLGRLTRTVTADLACPGLRQGTRVVGVALRKHTQDLSSAVPWLADTAQTAPPTRPAPLRPGT